MLNRRVGLASVSASGRADELVDRLAMDSIGEFPVYAVLPASDFSRARSRYEEKLGLTPLRGGGR